MLSRDAVKSFYDHFGARQDAQAFYEDRALADLLAHAGFASAHHVFEFGVGTGRFAARLLKSELPAQARYTGVDISSTMIELARSRLHAYASRVDLLQSDGSPTCSVPDASVDRIVSTYVLDLLSLADIHSFLGDCRRALTPTGKLALVSLTPGRALASRIVTASWRTLFRISPRLVGGCRPLHLAPFVEGVGFRLLHARVVTAFAVASEVIVAEALAAP